MFDLLFASLGTRSNPEALIAIFLIAAWLLTRVSEFVPDAAAVGEVPGSRRGPGDDDLARMSLSFSSTRPAGTGSELDRLALTPSGAGRSSPGAAEDLSGRLA